MKTDNLPELFADLDFDYVEPMKGHQERFSQKLHGGPENPTRKAGVSFLWPTILSVAAGLLMGFLIFSGIFKFRSPEIELATISPEMENTELFYSSQIRKELFALNKNASPATAIIIRDALKQLQILEQDYDDLEVDLGRSGGDERVIHAMVKNFQKRIHLLNQVLSQVKTINTLKNNTHESKLL